MTEYKDEVATYLAREIGDCAHWAADLHNDADFHLARGELAWACKAQNAAAWWALRAVDMRCALLARPALPARMK